MKHRIALLFIVAALLASLLVDPASTASAQESDWTPPALVSGTTKSSWFPDIGVAPDGGVHIVWASGKADVPNPKAEDGIDLLMYRALKDGQWSPINDIANPGTGGYATRNSLVAGRDGALHVLLRSQLRVDYIRAPDDQAFSFQNWSTPRKISNLTTPYYATLVQDGKGVLHGLWNEAVNDAAPSDRPACPGCTDVFYRRSNDNGQSWSEPVNISQMPEGSVKPQIKVDGQDNLHVVWEEGYDTLTGRGPFTAGVYRRSRDGGTTWDPAVRFVLPALVEIVPTPVPGSVDPAATSAPSEITIPDAPRQVSLGLFKNTDPIIVFRAAATNRIYYALGRENGTVWNNAVPLDSVRARGTNDTPWDSYSLATDGVGNVHLLLSGLLAADTSDNPIPRVLHLIWDGQTWSQPAIVDPEESYPPASRVFKGPDDAEAKPVHLYPEWPRMVVGNGNTLHITWFTRDSNDLFNSDNAHYQVWYSTRRLNVQAIAPAPTFTPVPTVATPQPTALPTAIPIPTLTRPAALAPQLSDPRTWERPGMRLVGLAALPVIGFLGLFFIVGLVVRRRR